MRTKILYVEDEITKNISKIKRLFKKFLSEQIIEELNKLEEDEYGADANELEKVIGQSDVIDLEYSFQGALDKIINNRDDYAFFIIDRNLSSHPYNLQTIKEVDPSFNQKQYEKHLEREGDYLLEKLVYEKVDVLNRFYFLTAYSVSELPNRGEIEKHIDFSKFREENIVEKSNREQEQNLISLINNAEILNIHLDNKVYIDMIKSISDKHATNNTIDFIELLRTRCLEDSQVIEMNLGRIRKITESILGYIAHKYKAPQECYSGKNRDLISFRNVIYWLSHDEEKNEKYKFNSNVMIKSYLYDIISICSEFGVHRSDSGDMGFLPTVNTVQALILELKEIMLWAGTII